MKTTPRSRHPVSDSSVVRLSVSVSAEDKDALERIAADKKVSLAWVIRDALSQYLAIGGDAPKGK